MPIGDDASAAGYPLVPDTGDDGRVTLGAQEINRTRDLVAELAALIPAIWPVINGGTGGNTPATARNGIGIFAGTDAASDTTGGAVDGNIYFQILST
jgi:hypothetical protein